MLIGNNIVNIGASAFATERARSRIFGDGGVVYATIVMSVLVIIFAEVLPKTVAITAPDRVALSCRAPGRLVVTLFGADHRSRSSASCG